jgi:hypothetical protein
MQDLGVIIRELAEEMGTSNGLVNFTMNDDLAMWERGSCIITTHQLIPCNGFNFLGQI